MDSEAATVAPDAARTMAQLVRAAAAAYGEDVAVRRVRDDGGEEAISFAGLERRSAAVARGLLARGVGKGGRIGFVFGNGPDFAVMLAAIARIGAIAVPISTLIKANELVRVLRQSDVAGVILQRSLLGHDYVERFRDAMPALRDGPAGPLRIAEAPYLRWLVSTGDDLPPAFGDMDALIAEGATVDERLLRAVEAEVHPTDQMVEIYTSGSMALPKGVRHLHDAVFARARYLRGMLGREHGQEVSAQLPMFWVGGLMLSLLPAWIAGATVLCTDRTLNNSRFSVGAVLADEDLRLTASRPYWGLGMSETLGPYSHGDVHRVAGRPVCAPLDHWAEGFEVRVGDEDGRPVGDGAVGEIQVRGPAVAPGLHKIERDGHYTADGFLRTGDMGEVEGVRVHFTGRRGDMIKTDGSNVSPAEVEMELQALDGVHNAYVVGLPDAERGQIVAAAVIAREGVTLDPAALQAELRRRLSGYKVPRGLVQIGRDEVPMLASNKVARRQIEAMLIERLGRQG